MSNVTCIKKTCYTIIFQQDIENNSGNQEKKIENLQFEPFPIVIKLIPNRIISSRNIS